MGLSNQNKKPEVDKGFHENFVDLNKKYGIPVSSKAKGFLKNLKLKLKKDVADRMHNLEHKHIDFDKVDEMTAEDFVGMCPHQRAEIMALRMKQYEET